MNNCWALANNHAADLLGVAPFAAPNSEENDDWLVDTSDLWKSKGWCLVGVVPIGDGTRVDLDAAAPPCDGHLNIAVGYSPSGRWHAVLRNGATVVMAPSGIELASVELVYVIARQKPKEGRRC